MGIGTGTGHGDGEGNGGISGGPVWLLKNSGALAGFVRCVSAALQRTSLRHGSDLSL